MKPETLVIKVELQILKPSAEVFEAIVDPRKMTNYFISKSTGRLEEGKQVMWRFPEFDLEFPVRAGKIVPDNYISFFREADGQELLVEITLKQKSRK